MRAHPQRYYEHLVLTENVSFLYALIGLIRPAIPPFLSLSVYLFARLFVCLFVYLSVSLAFLVQMYHVKFFVFSLLFFFFIIILLCYILIHFSSFDVLIRFKTNFLRFQLILR